MELHTAKEKILEGADPIKANGEWDYSIMSREDAVICMDEYSRLVACAFAEWIRGNVNVYLNYGAKDNDLKFMYKDKNVSPQKLFDLFIKEYGK